MTLKSKSDLSYHFLQSTRLAQRSDESLDACWLLTWRRERSSSSRTIGEQADVNGMEKEGDIYTLLESNRMPNIAPFGKGNDFRDHTTLTHTLRDEKWACWSRD